MLSGLMFANLRLSKRVYPIDLDLIEWIRKAYEKIALEDSDLTVFPQVGSLFIATDNAIYRLKLRTREIFQTKRKGLKKISHVDEGDKEEKYIINGVSKSYVIYSEYPSPIGLTSNAFLLKAIWPMAMFSLFIDDYVFAFGIDAFGGSHDQISLGLFHIDRDEKFSRISNYCYWLKVPSDFVFIVRIAGVEKKVKVIRTQSSDLGWDISEDISPEETTNILVFGDKKAPDYLLHATGTIDDFTYTTAYKPLHKGHRFFDCEPRTILWMRA